MRVYPSVTITAGQSQSVSLPGSVSALAALRFYNFTASTLEIAIGGQTPIVAPQTRDLITIDPGWQWDGSFTITPVQDVTLASLSNVVRIVGFGSGETIPGTDPAPLLASVGASMNGISIVGFHTWVVQVDTSGNLTFTDLTTGRSLLMGQGNGGLQFGNIEGVGLGNQSIIDFFSAGGHQLIIAPPQNAGAAANTIVFEVWDGSSTHVPFDIGPGGPGISYVDLSGIMQLTAQPTLQHGNQETGMCGMQVAAPVASASWGYYVNFKTRMTNIPSSITLSASFSVNASVSTGSITKDGFFFQIAALVAGNAEWGGTYTTVGN